MIDLVEFHIVEHCNLNCKGCIHFSPLAEKSFVSIKEYREDVKNTSKLLSDELKEIHILGGEPLLHPNIEKILKITRKYFPKTEIKLISNGILVCGKKESFWQEMKKNNIQLAVTMYPINVDYKKISHITKKYGIKYSFYALSKENSQWHFPIDLEGVQDSEYSFNNCRKGNNCTNINIVNGKLFICPISSNIKYFNKYFNKNCEITTDDYLKINNIKKIQEIKDFISKPIPFCRYCDIKNRTFNNHWETSKKKIDEWI